MTNFLKLYLSNMKRFPCKKLPQMISWNPNIVEHLTKLRNEYNTDKH